jgi:hypothetical protein
MTDTHEHRRSRPAVAPDGTKYRVVAAKKGVPFNELSGATGGGANPVEWLLNGLLGMAIDVMLNLRTDGSSTWKIGAKRVGRLGWERFVHKELLAPGLEPEQRMDELIDSITQGLRI